MSAEDTGLKLYVRCRMPTEYIKNGESYLVDETTAVAKFIFPCGEVRTVNDSSFEPEPETGDVIDSGEKQKRI